RRARLAELEEEASRAGLWDDPDRARIVTTELSRVKDDVDELEGLRRQLSDAETLHELAREEADESIEPELAQAVAELDRRLDQLELRSLFSGEHDEREAVCEIHSGAGGTDSQDWAEMLLRMYLRWAERKGFAVELDEVSPGQEAGITSATFIVRGRYAYGLLAGERGVHRLVRISPFDANARRHTGFSSFDCVPFLEDATDEVEIDEKDLRIDTYRSSGAGGQHVNVTDSAVRITHLPTGIVVSCQNERSQIHNREMARKILRARIYELELEKKQKELQAVEDSKLDIAWRSQIRSYVLHPYRMVKDHRTKHETSNTDRVLDGDLDDFIYRYLIRKGGRKRGIDDAEARKS